MDNNLKARVLDFLYKWVNDSKIPQIRKAMVEELETFILAELNAAQVSQIAKRMEAQVEVVDAQDPK